MTTPAQRVNYDLIAHLYDEPGRNYDTDQNLLNFLQQRSISQPRILDMGCGTGKKLTADHNKFPELQMVGIDLFHGMLLQAKKRCNEIIWLQGDNTNLPFRNNSFDYITNQFSYHHVQDKLRLITETYRILNPGGRFVITNIDPWSMSGWVVYEYFPASKKRDLSDFLPVDDVLSKMKKIGFCNIQVKRDHTWNEKNLYEFLCYASQRHRTSQLIAIRNHEYEEGITKLKDDIVKLGNDFRVSSEICLVWVSGDKS